jgi:hypothetical protein
VSIRYTLRLVENGAEVWKRWTGDREEALRDIAATLVDLETPEPTAVWFMQQANELDQNLIGGRYGHVSCFIDQGLTTQIGFHVRQTAPKE